MSHEPECLEATSPREGFYECMCDDLRAAYERGREDAANALEPVLGESLGRASVAWSETPSGVFDDVTCAALIDKCVAAARGYGEQR